MKAHTFHFYSSSGVCVLFLISLLLNFPLQVFGQNSQTFTSSGTFTVPSNITSITVECWGGGGAGGGATGNPAAGGGGAGGSYVKSILTVTPGSTYTVTVGGIRTATASSSAATNKGNPSWFGSVSTIYAAGGNGGAPATSNSTNGAAGLTSTSGCIGDIIYGGGSGANGIYTGGTPGGAGGGGAGSTGAGGNASAGIRGAGTPLNGGNGANGVSNSTVGAAGSVYGGGGSGGKANSSTDRAGGSGAAGLVVVTWTCPVISTFPFSESFNGSTFPPSCWSVFNAGSGNNWTRSTTTPYSGAGTMVYSYSSTSAANAWAFTPGLQLQNGHSYTVSFYQRVASATYPEKLKVTVGNDATVAAQTNIIWNNAGGTSLTNTTYTLRSANFVCPADGIYYFAFNCFSDADMYNLFVDEVTFTDEGISCDFNVSRNSAYTGQSVLFTDASSGSATSWTWNFGEGAIPVTADTEGPHEVHYTTPGLKTVSLTINGSTTTTKSEFLSIALPMPPRQLTAEVTGFSDVVLNWLSPALNEGFEPYDDFDLSFGNFTFRDIDGGVTYGIQDVTFPNSAYTGSFIAFNPSLAVPPLTGAWLPHSGKKYAACFAALTASAPNNDWIITPKITVSAGEQLSFWAKSVTNQYGLERFKVGISSTGTEPADFTNISSGSYVEAPLEWTQFTYDLTAYAGQQIYIGVNCVSNDAFVFMLDDLAITGGPLINDAQSSFGGSEEFNVKPTKTQMTGPSVIAPDQIGSQRSFATYKIYRNGSEIADLNGFTFTDPDLVPGTYNYSISAVYSDPVALSEPEGPAQVVTEITRWTGSVNSDWQNSGNWRTNQTPNASAKIGIPGNGIVHYPVITQQGVECTDITLKPGATLQINPSASLSVSGSFTNLTGVSGLVIKSDATGTGSLLTNSSGLSGTIERFIAAADWGQWDDGWHFISSPVATQTINADGGFVTSGPPADDYDLYAWYEPGNVWVNFKNTNSSPTWNEANNYSLDFLAGKGYMAAYQVTDIKEFKGLLNVDDVSVAGLGISGGSNRSWHLLGNPYASALAWDGTWTTSNIAGVAKIWNEAGKAYQDLTPADVENSVIPCGNGFMVEVSSGTGSLTIPASKRIHSSKEFQKSSTLPLIVLTARNNDHPSFQQSYLVFNPLSTSGFDVSFDGHFLPGYAPLFYSVCNGENLSTNTLPAIDPETVVPFGFIKNEGTAFSIEASISENFPGTVYLKDKLTGTDHDFSGNTVYHFTAGGNDSPDRFLIHFKTLGMEGYDSDDQLFIYPSGEHVIISAAEALTSRVRICNLQGGVVLETMICNRTHTELDVSSLSKGMYIVTLQSGGLPVSRKIVL